MEQLSCSYFPTGVSQYRQNYRVRNAHSPITWLADSLARLHNQICVHLNGIKAKERVCKVSPTAHHIEITDGNVMELKHSFYVEASLKCAFCRAKNERKWTMSAKSSISSSQKMHIPACTASNYGFLELSLGATSHHTLLLSMPRRDFSKKMLWWPHS